MGDFTFDYENKFNYEPKNKLSNIFRDIKKKLKDNVAPYRSYFGKDKKAIDTKYLIGHYNKKYKDNPASVMIIQLLVDLYNQFNGDLYYSTQGLVDLFNESVALEENYITFDSARKILMELDWENIIFNDYTRFLKVNDRIIAYSGLISGDTPAFKDPYFKTLIDSAVKFSSFDDFINDSFSFFVKDIKNIDKLEKAFNMLKSKNIERIYLSELTYNKYDHEYINFDLLAIVKPFYNALGYAHKNKWEASKILTEKASSNRKDNYINRHIHLNIKYLAQITGTTRFKSELYKELKKNRKQRIMRYCRRLNFTMYDFIFENCKNDSEYNTFLKNKTKFYNDCCEKLSDNVLAEILNEDTEERKTIELYIPDEKKAKKILAKFIRYMAKIKQKITPDIIYWCSRRLIDNIKLEFQKRLYIDSYEKNIILYFILKYSAITK